MLLTALQSLSSGTLQVCLRSILNGIFSHRRCGLIRTCDAPVLKICSANEAAIDRYETFDIEEHVY